MLVLKLRQVVRMTAPVCRCGRERSHDGFCTECGEVAHLCRCASVDPVWNTLLNGITSMTPGPAPEPMTIAEIVRAFENARGVDDVFALLKDTDAPVDPIDQQLVRFKLAEVLKRWKIPVKSLDEWLKVKAAERAMTGIIFPEHERWPDPVDGTELVADIEAFFERFVHAPAESILAAALWTIWTHAFDLFDIAPLLVLTSPTKRCGKTTMLKLIGSVAARRLFSSNVTGAVLFRVIEKYRPTLLIDEADNFARFNDELKGLLNAGHERMTAQATRTVGDDHDVKTFSTWAPKAFTAIGSLPDTVEDRAIRIVMLRKPADVRKDRARSKALTAAANPLASRCVRWAADNAVLIRGMEEPALDALHDRAADNWAPLVVIAELCGVRDRAERAAAVLTSGEEAGVGELLLEHVREAFGDLDRIGTAELLEALVNRDDGPWAKWWASDVDSPAGRKKAAADLARKLRRFDPALKAGRHMSGGERERGYDRAQFKDIWKRWLPTEASTSPGLGNLGHLGHLGQDDPETRPLTSGNGGVAKGDKVPKVISPRESVDGTPTDPLGNAEG
jgi:putative DNA primase/helicase